MQAWPWCGDTREDRARRVALSYRRLMEMALAGQIDDLAIAFEQLDAKWLELGENWLKPSVAPLDLDAWLTPAAMAELFEIRPDLLRKWAGRGHIRAMVVTPRLSLYCVGDVVAYARTRRLCRSTGVH